MAGNRASRNGGGIASENVFVVEVNDSVIGDNIAATGSGGGISSEEDSNVTVRRSLIHDNRAVNRGGLRVSNAKLRRDLVTIGGNSATTEGGGILVSGNVDRQTLIDFSTIADNQASTTGGLHVRPPNGASPGAKISINSSIVAFNAGGDCVSSRITTRGYNLSSSSSCGFTGTGDIQPVDPKLGPLANNGGTSRTHALLPGSPGLDGGDPTINSSLASCSPTDQRGLPAPGDGNGNGENRCDIGAFEQQTPLVADLSVTLSDAPDPFNVGQETVVTATVSNNGPATATSVVVTLDSSRAISAVTSNVSVTCAPSISHLVDRRWR